MQIKIRCNLEAEKQILGYLLNEDEETPYIFQLLKPDDLYEQQHRSLFKAAKDAWDVGEGINAVLLSEKFDPAFIGDIMNSGCMSHHVESLCRSIKRLSTHRRLLSILNTNKAEAENADDPEAVINATAEQLSSLATGDRRSYITNEELMEKALQQLESRANTSEITGIPTGFIDLDEKTQGWQKQHLVFLGAVPKMGKTSLALEFALNVAAQNYSSLYFTLEMSAEEMADRQISSQGEIKSSHIRSGRLRRDDFHKAINVATGLSTHNLGWVDRGSVSVTEIKAICRQYKNKYGLDFVVIDQLDKIERSIYQGENDANAMKRITTQLKIMAKELDCTVLCLCQLLDKVVSARPVPRPQHGDEKGSSAPSEDADIVMFLWRPEFYFENQYEGMAELFIARQRSGPSASIWVTWRPEITKFLPMPKDCWPDEVVVPKKK